MPATFDEAAATHLDERDDKEQLGGNVLFYLAVADRFFGPIVDALGKGRSDEEAARAGGAW